MSNFVAAPKGSNPRKAIKVVIKVSQDLSSLWKELQVFETLLSAERGATSQVSQFFHFVISLEFSFSTHLTRELITFILLHHFAKSLLRTFGVVIVTY